MADDRMSKMSLNSTQIKLMEVRNRNALFHSPNELYKAIRNQAYTDRKLIQNQTRVQNKSAVDNNKRDLYSPQKYAMNKINYIRAQSREYEKNKLRVGSKTGSRLNKSLASSFMNKSNVNNKVARDLIKSKLVREPKFNRQEVKKPTEKFDNQRYLQNLKQKSNNWDGKSITDSLGKKMHILDQSQEAQEMKKQREVASEIDYSDHRSAMDVINKYSNRKIKSRAASILTNDNLKKLDKMSNHESKQKSIISRGGGASIYSDARSQISRLKGIVKSQSRSKEQSVRQKSEKSHFKNSVTQAIEKPKINITDEKAKNDDLEATKETEEPDKKKEDVNNDKVDLKEEITQKCLNCENILRQSELEFYEQMKHIVQNANNYNSDAKNDIENPEEELPVLCAKCVYLTLRELEKTHQTNEHKVQRLSSPQSKLQPTQNQQFQSPDKSDSRLFQIRQNRDSQLRNISNQGPENSTLPKIRASNMSFELNKAMSPQIPSKVINQASPGRDSKLAHTQLLRKQVEKMNKSEIEAELKKMQPDLFTTTAHAEYAWQPFEPINMDSTYRKKKNEFSIFVEASFQGGVFKMPLIDPPTKQSKIQNELLEFEKQRKMM